MEKLVNIMKANPDIARGVYKRSQISEKWEQYTSELNSLGPPVRNGDKWLKVRNHSNMPMHLCKNLFISGMDRLQVEY